MRVKSNIQYGNISQSQKLDLYFPNKFEKSLPLILFIHGGGFSKGDKAKGKIFDFVKFNQNFIIASVNYRLSGEAGFPAGIEDCANALFYLIKNSKKYGIDSTRVAIIGCSSGGNYALMLGINKKLVQNFKKICIVALYPVTDLLALQKIAKSLKDGDPNKQYMIKNSELYFDKNFSDISVRQLKKASPFYMLTEFLPCTLLQHGTADDTAPISQSQSFYDKAKAMGLDINLDVIQGAEHGDNIFVQQSNLKRIFDFIVSNLGE